MIRRVNKTSTTRSL